MEGISLAKIIVSLYTLIGFSGGIPVEIDAVISELQNPDDATKVYAAALEATDIKVINGRDGDEIVSEEHFDKCKALAYKALVALPGRHVKQLEELTFYYSPGAHRGYGGPNRILLRCQDMEDSEFVGVLIHEMGHLVDTGMMDGDEGFGASEFMDGSMPVYKNDGSLGYYEISWANEVSLKNDAGRLDFVSGYGMSDPYEDFAEAYAFYVLNGESFRKMAEEDNELKAKYLFMKEEVFDGVEYNVGEFEVVERVRSYDVTVLPYKLDDLLSYNINQ